MSCAQGKLYGYTTIDRQVFAKSQQPELYFELLPLSLAAASPLLGPYEPFHFWPLQAKPSLLIPEAALLY